MGNAKVKTLAGESAENSHSRSSWLSHTWESSGGLKIPQASERRMIPLAAWAEPLSCRIPFNMLGLRSYLKAGGVRDSRVGVATTTSSEVLVLFCSSGVSQDGIHCLLHFLALFPPVLG